MLLMPRGPMLTLLAEVPLIPATLLLERFLRCPLLPLMAYRMTALCVGISLTREGHPTTLMAVVHAMILELPVMRRWFHCSGVDVQRQLSVHLTPLSLIRALLASSPSSWVDVTAIVASLRNQFRGKSVTRGAVRCR